MPNKTNYFIREYQSSDMETVKKLIDHTIDTSYPGDYCPEAVDFFKEHHSLDRINRSSEKDYIIVLIFDDYIVGTGTLAGDEIQRVFVDPAYQGYGFGKAIMLHLEDKACQLGILKVRIDASLPSLDFYHVLGYVTTEVTFEPVANDKRLDYEKMEKEL